MAGVRAKVGTRLANALLMLLATLVLLEVLLRLVAPRPLDAPLQDQLEEARAQVQRLQQARAGDLMDPVLHHVTVPSQKARGLVEGREVHVSVNRQAFRGAADFPLQAGPSECRVAILGDSFAFGAQVNDDEVYAARTESLLRVSGAPWRVLNFGRISYSPILYGQLFRSQVRLFHPDVVVVAPDNTDLQDDYFYGLDAIMDAHGEPVAFKPEHYAYFLGSLRVANAEQRADDLESQLDSVVGFWVGWARSHLQLGAYLRDLLLPPRVIPGDINSDRWGHFRADWSSHWEATQHHLNRLLVAVEAEHATPLLLIYPHAVQVSPDQWKARVKDGFAVGRTYQTPFPGWLHGWARAHQVATVDVNSVFAQHAPTQKLFLDEDPHFTAAGHALVAQELAAAITRLHACPQRP